MENNQALSQPLYGLEDRPSTWETFLLGFQHMLAMFVGVITPPLIIAGVLGLNVAETGFFVSMALVASGITTYIQCRKVGPVGSGLLGVQGTSFTFVPMAIGAAKTGGMPLVLGMSLIAAPVEIVLSYFIKQTKRFFPPIVTGTVVMLIGLSLVQVGITDFGGGVGAKNFGGLQNLFLGSLVLVMIIIANRYGKGMMKVGSIAIGLIVGYVVAILMGLIDFTPVAEAGWFTLPVPFKYGFSFDLMHLLPWLIGYLITTIESIGDLTAVAEVSGERVDTETHIERLSGGILADGVGSVIAAIFNSLPNTTFSQNTGVIQLTKVGSRVVGYAAAGILLVLGLVPKFAAIVSVMPNSVLGGATIAMFGMIATSGIKIVTKGGLTDRKLFILALSLAFGLGVTMKPSVVAQLPQWLSAILSSGITVGAIISIALHLILPEDEVVENVDNIDNIDEEVAV